MAEQKLLHPLVLWAQRKDVIFLTISLEDSKNPDIKVEKNKMIFRSKGGPQQKEYGFEFTFFKDIDPENSKQHITSRELTFVLKKEEKDGPYWPRLLSTADKIGFLKTDFNKWRDEDDSDADDSNVNQSFEDMMKQMGDIQGTDGDVGEPDSDDSDDEGMPDLE